MDYFENVKLLMKVVVFKGRIASLHYFIAVYQLGLRYFQSWSVLFLIYLINLYIPEYIF